MTARASVAAVVIGRNEGARLLACLDSLAGRVARVVYVDSGSSDGSVAAAAARGAEVVALDLSRPFTAARARNEGAARLAAEGMPRFIQFLDGDCTLAPGWIDAARAALLADPGLALVCGRRRERDPGASLWNRLIDREWDRPPGETKACGGDFLIRSEAFARVGGFDARVIAGEEPEMCVRLRRAGWRIHRLDAEMTVHDAAMTRVSQWWRRARRAGYAYALGASLHGAPPERHYVPQLRRALLWGAALPLLAVSLALAVSPWALALLAAYPAQAARIAARDGDRAHAAFTVLAKIPEALGAAAFAVDRARGRTPEIIEYK
ncbi:glycosyltransferase [Rhodovulum sp. 12E13]|uniref:glycosyltransferase family 2 protein n=1 Tax=Rhodovulum sp. 12E13 TaxID=2203891 RepID=UPI000E153D3E|nr:glycosyltransferase [Rhodovulum sp. 12E13]RDC73750.1 glycosyltransferase [Rhodovulum sp. 12E13]